MVPFTNRFLRLLLYALMGMIWLSCCNNSQAEAKTIPQPALYDIEHLNELRSRGLDDPSIGRFIRRVKKIAKEQPVSVVGKQHSYSSNPHDYCSLAGYSWADENNPNGAYITKDGILNPERENYDRPKLTELSNRAKFLSVAFYLTEDSLFYDSFLANLRAWFLDSLTYMSPNFEYAQVSKGKRNNKGQPYGLVDMTSFTPVIESILLVNSVREIGKEDITGLKEWFSSFLDWVLGSYQWQIASMSNNNITTGCYVAMMDMARFTGNKQLVRRIKRGYTRLVLKVQIDNDGKQPAELKRTNGFGYSVGNLRHIIDFALIMETMGVHYYKKNQRSIDSAFEYLIQFIDNHDSFPYQQINKWDHYEELLRENASRLQRLSSNQSAVTDYSRGISLDYSSDILDYVY